MGFIPCTLKPAVDGFLTDTPACLPSLLVRYCDTYNTMNNLLLAVPESLPFVKAYLSLACCRHSQILAQRGLREDSSPRNTVVAAENPVKAGIVSAVPVKNVILDYEADAEPLDPEDGCHKYYLNVGMTGGRSGRRTVVFVQ